MRWRGSRSGQAVAEASAPRVQRRRVFFALAPDAGTRSAIVKATRKAVRACRGRPVKPDNLHLTLAVLGALAPAELDAAMAAPPVAAEPLELTLDRLGHFARARVLWLAPSEPPAGLLALERGLWHALGQRGFDRAPGLYHPHVTLARKAGPAAETIRPVSWHVSALSLFESVPVEGGVRYAALKTWPF